MENLTDIFQSSTSILVVHIIVMDNSSFSGISFSVNLFFCFLHTEHIYLIGGFIDRVSIV